MKTSLRNSPSASVLGLQLPHSISMIILRLFRAVALPMMFMTILVFSSCEEKNNDEESPTIQVTAPEGEFVKDVFMLKAEAADNASVKEIKILIDGVPLKTIASGSVNEAWDSKSVEDGEHTIEFVAKDAAGNTHSETIVVNVLNYFIKVVIPQSSLPGADVWFYATYEDGTLIDVKQAEDGKTLGLETPEDHENSKRYTLYQFEYAEDSYNHVRVYTKVKADTYRHFQAYFSNEIGTADINIHKDGGGIIGARVEGVGLYSSGTTVNDQGANIKLYLEENNIDVFAVVYNTFSSEKYSIVQNVSTGSSHNLDYAEMSEFNRTDITVAGNPSVSWTDTYAVPDGDYKDKLFVGQYYSSGGASGTFQPVYLFPGTTFSEYVFRAWYTDGFKTYHHHRNASSAPTQFEKLDAELTSLEYDAGMLNVQMTGSFDYKKLHGIAFKNSFRTDWYVFADGTAANTIKLAVPETLISKYNPHLPSELDFFEAEAVSMDGFENYDEYIDHHLHPDGPDFYSIVSETKSVAIYHQ